MGSVSAMPRALMPGAFMLYGNFPNPFRGSTRIRFDLPIKVPVALVIYDLKGRLLRELIPAGTALSAGTHTLAWDGCDLAGNALASGPYIYRIAAPGWVNAKMMMIVR